MAEWHRIITSPYTGSMSMTGSFNVDGDATITGNVTINGTASVENLIVKQIGYSSGSNQLGDAVNDVQSLYGTVVIPTGSLVVNGNMNFSGSRTIQPLTASLNTKGPTLTVLGGLAGATSGNGGDLVLKGGNGINAGNTGGDVYIQGGDRTGAQRSGNIVIGITNNDHQTYLQGTPIFNWDGPATANAATFQRNGSTRFVLFDDVLSNSDYYFRGGANTINAVWNNWNSVTVRGKGTTSSTIAFRVQNSNLSSSLLIRDDQTATFGGQINATIIRNVGSSITLEEYLRSTSNTWYFQTQGAIDLLSLGLSNSIFRAASSVSVGSGVNANASAQLEILSTTKGLLLPRTNLLSNISNPAQGLITYLTSSGNEGLWYYNSGSYQGWTEILNNSGSQNITGSLSISGIPSTSSAALTVYKSGSTVVDVQGSSGQLFSVTDSLSGSLFSVNTAAGLPTIEAFSDNTVNIGKFGTYPIKVVSLGTSAVVSGSFSGSGADLSGIPASAIVGLNLSRIATGSVTASVGLGTGSFSIVSGSSNFFFVSSSGNIGIGTSSPIYKLDVVGTSRLDGILIQDTVSDQRITANRPYFFLVGGGAVFQMQGGNFSTGQYNTTAKFDIKGSGTTSATTALLVQNANASSSLAVLDNGNVGIGTATPGATLDARGSVFRFGNGVTSNIEVVSDGTTSGLQSYNNPNGIVIRTLGTQPINFATNTSTTVLTITGSSAGIGTTAPSAKLHIVGSGTTSATTPLLVQNSLSTASLQLTDDGIIKFFDTNAAVVGSTYTTFIPKYSSNNMALGFYEGSSPVLRFVIYRDNSNNVYLTTSGGNAFTASPQAATLPGTLNVTSALTASSAIISGNVTVLGTASISNLIVNQIAYSSGSNQLGDAADDFQTLYGTVRIPTGSLTVTGSLDLKSTTSNTATLLTLQVSESSASTLAFTGKVPKLTLVSNTDGPSSGGTGPDYLLELNKAGASGLPRVGIRIINAGVNSSIESYRSVTTGVVNLISTGIMNGSTEVLTVAGNLNVGINNIDPTAKLTVKGSGTTSATTSFLVQNSAAGEAFKITDNRTTTISGTQTNLSTSNVYVGALSLTSAGVGATGQGIWSTGADGQMVLAGSLGGFVLQSWANSTISLINTVNPRNLFSIQQYGFSDGNTNGLTGNTMNIAPIYNFTGVRPSATVRGIYYNPTLTSLVNTNHIAIETTTGDVLLGTTSGNVGIRTTSPSSTLDVSGSGRFTNNLTVTGSFTVVTGSSIEFQVNQTGVKIGNATTDSHSITGSLAISASASTGSALTVYKSGSTVMSIQGSQGELFSITDSLSGSLFSVSNVSGLPILEVFSDNTTLVGDYLAPALITTKRMTVNSGSTVIYSLPTASYDGAFFDYTIKSGSNARAGSIFGTYISTTASYTDTSTFDIGDTTGVAFALIVSGSNMVLTGSASTSGWALKTIIRSI